ncbi:acetate kinase [Marispirochaeta aestuarii]|uniref:acetate kinase n=1 Tax=Marispirochaeta aestuarii TaxID=1963862 RepID=UPI0029C879F7|nr:acetate kinase [Marispirochaeta aestuarii]
MTILTLNCGSSSVKYQLYDWDNKVILAAGIVERVTQPGSVIEHRSTGKEEITREHACPTHKEAIQLILETLVDSEYGALSSIDEIRAVGHRVVHGGEKFARSVVVDGHVLDSFKAIQDLAPLHNPANILGITSAQEVMPNIPHCAIMDTAWHQTMPKTSYMYALPYKWYEDHAVRRYGFHGTSFLYCAKRAAVLLGKDPFETNVIIAHIGNGSSINAVKNGVSVDTSMGLTPLEGLIMGTRSGDIDPAIPFFMMKKLGLSPDEMETILNKKSGVLGITEKYVDRRDIEMAAADGDKKAQLSIDMESYRLKKYVGAYAAALGRVDALVFTAGVGERGPQVRERVCKEMEHLGIKVDMNKNTASMTRYAETELSTPDSPVKVFVIPTDEELVMTEDTYALLEGTYKDHTEYTYYFQNPDYVNKSRQEALKKDLAKRPGLDKILVYPPKK